MIGMKLSMNVFQVQLCSQRVQRGLRNQRHGQGMPKLTSPLVDEAEICGCWQLRHEAEQRRGHQNSPAAAGPQYLAAQQPFTARPTPSCGPHACCAVRPRDALWDAALTTPELVSGPRGCRCWRRACPFAHCCLCGVRRCQGCAGCSCMSGSIGVLRLPSSCQNCHCVAAVRHEQLRGKARICAGHDIASWLRAGSGKATRVPLSGPLGNGCCKRRSKAWVACRAGSRRKGGCEF